MMLASPSAPGALDFHFAGADVRVYAPQNVLDVFDRMFAHVSHQWSGVLEPIAVEVQVAADMWHIGGSSPESRKTLDRNSSLQQVAGATVSSLLAELGYHREISVWRAAVVQRDDEALILAGDDWESAITVAAHLHARGWRMISGDYALVDLGSMHAIPFRKLLHVNSSSIGSFPIAYRGAIEASPWYSSTHAISFYAIDPTVVNGQAAWGERSRVRAVLKIDGRTAPNPSLESSGDFTLTETLSRGQLPESVTTAMLLLGGFVETADFIERWFSTLSPSA